LLGSWTFALVLAVIPLTYVAFDHKKPKKIKVILSEFGIKVGKKIYQYGRIEAFWIHYTPPMIKTLNLRVYGEYFMDVEIQLHNQDPMQVHNFLSRKLPELEGKNESFITVLAKVLKI
jgi:hypothetical protein